MDSSSHRLTVRLPPAVVPVVSLSAHAVIDGRLASADCPTRGFCWPCCPSLRAVTPFCGADSPGVLATIITRSPLRPVRRHSFSSPRISLLACRICCPSLRAVTAPFVRCCLALVVDGLTLGGRRLPAARCRLSGSHGSFVCVRYASRYPARRSASKRHAAMIRIWSSASNRLCAAWTLPRRGSSTTAGQLEADGQIAAARGSLFPDAQRFLSVLCRVGRLGFRWRCCC